MKQEKGNVLIILLVVAAVAAAGIFWYISRSGSLSQQTEQERAFVPPITNTADFDTASRELDNTNLNQMDSDLDQVNTDSLSF